MPSTGKQHPPTTGASIALITSTTNNTNKHGTNKNQHTVEFSKNKHTPSRTTLPWSALGQLVQSTERDTWCQLAGTALHRARLAGDHEGLQRRRVTGSCPPRLGCRSALPRLRTNFGGCQSPSPTIARPSRVVACNSPKFGSCGSDTATPMADGVAKRMRNQGPTTGIRGALVRCTQHLPSTRAIPGTTRSGGAMTPRSGCSPGEQLSVRPETRLALVASDDYRRGSKSSAAPSATLTSRYRGNGVAGHDVDPEAPAE